MRRVTKADSGRHGRRRALGVAVVTATVVAVMIDPGPANATAVPTPPTNQKVCFPKVTPGHPVMTSFTRTPTSVNVKSSNKTISFTIKATDSTKNITSVSVLMQSPKIGTVQRASFASLHKTSGTLKNGTWKGTATINKWTNNGTWNITQVFFFDAGGGFSFYIPTGGGTAPWNGAWPKTFKVISTPDVKPPTVTSVKLAPTSVNTSSAVRTIKVTVTAKDALSGISGGVFAFGQVTVAGKGHSTIGGFLPKTHGTTHNGTFSGKMTVPRWVGAGTHVWSLSVGTGDLAGNGTNLNSAQLKAKKFASRFKVISKTDNSKPQLRGLTYTPHSVDARKGPKSVKITLKASDTLSGVAGAQVTFTSPSGFRSNGGFLSRTAGSPGSGTWKGTVVIPKCSEPGVWTVSVNLTDVAGNNSTYTTAQVRAKHFSTTLSVKALDIQSPSATVPAKVSHSGSAVVTFTEPTLWSGSSIPFQVSDATSFATINGAWTCKNASGGAVGCNTGVVKTASFNPTSNLTTGHKYTISSFGGIFDTSGNGPAFISATFKAT